MEELRQGYMGQVIQRLEELFRGPQQPSESPISIETPRIGHRTRTVAIVLVIMVALCAVTVILNMVSHASTVADGDPFVGGLEDLKNGSVNIGAIK